MACAGSNCPYSNSRVQGGNVDGVYHMEEIGRAGDQGPARFVLWDRQLSPPHAAPALSLSRLARRRAPARAARAGIPAAQAEGQSCRCWAPAAEKEGRKEGGAGGRGSSSSSPGPSPFSPREPSSPAARLLRGREGEAATTSRRPAAAPDPILGGSPGGGPSSASLLVSAEKLLPLTSSYPRLSGSVTAELSLLWGAFCEILSHCLCKLIPGVFLLPSGSLLMDSSKRKKKGQGRRTGSGMQTACAYGVDIFSALSLPQPEDACW
ncbi:uncharacterized protein LOC121920348 [Sceloporus undulatus]|uniref:uncharacterized protein LOC121920348 n=1 Tax=Sceloporus undulatus TaxID=8520 RepID=UPI001C4CCE06|nr:uncharacterized protein LOC121920348 [Sceloporus undulatus]